jgi:teichuronic acid biosynthesis glycosyltransferase TuaC
MSHPAESVSRDLRRIRRQVARFLVGQANRTGLVTWEQKERDAQLLVITNLWPDSELPVYGAFIRTTVRGLGEAGVKSDVLYVRGYKTKMAYMVGALAVRSVLIAWPDRYSIMHAHGGETALLLSSRGKTFTFASYLGTDLLGSQVGGPASHRASRELRSMVMRHHSRRINGVTVKTAEMAERLPTEVAERCRVIPDGVDRTKFRPMSRAAARRTLDWPLDQYTVLFAGRSEAPEKRLWLAESAVEQARASGGDFQLQVADGVDPELMPLYYNAADCLLHVSASEGSPNAVKEALACDLAVVATAAGDIPDLLAGIADCALCEADPVKLGEALIELKAKGPGRLRNGREQTEYLALETVTSRLVEYYTEISGLRLEDGP